MKQNFTTSIIISLLFLFSWEIHAQVGINTDNTSPDASAMLDVKSTDKGMLIPRMTTVQRGAITTPATGLLVYDTDTQSFWYYNGTAWIDLSAADEDWNYASGTGITGDVYHTGQVGIGNTAPTAPLDVTGTILVGSQNATMHNTTPSGTEGIVMPGVTSDYVISVQDGNGRVQHKWNATNGTSETFIVGGEDAAFIDITADVATDNTAWIEFKHADGASAAPGTPITWESHLMINQGGEVGINEGSPDDMLHVTDGGNGTRVRTENTGNGWAGLVAKNSVREIFIGIQGAFDANPGEFHIYDNTVGARRFVIDAAGEVGIGRNNPSVKLDVNGSVNCTGGTCSSDIRWKKDVQPLQNSLENILKLQGVTYDWRVDEFPDKDFDGDTEQIGLIAQEVEKIYPQLVRTDNEGFKSLDYMSLTAVLLEGIKEQQAEINATNTQLEELQGEIARLKKENETLQTQSQRLDEIEAKLERLSQESTSPNR